MTTSLCIFSWFLKKISCTEIVAVHTIRNVWVICKLIIMQFYRFPTPQSHCKIPILQNNTAKILGKAILSVKISLTIMHYAVYAKIFQPKLLRNNFYAKCSYMFHLPNKETNSLQHWLNSYHSCLCDTLFVPSLAYCAYLYAPWLRDEWSDVI